MMNRSTLLSLVFLFACLLAACGEADADAGIPVTGQGSALQLTVESPDGEQAFRQADQPISYNYVITNTGPQSLRGPVIVEDAPRQVSCPQLNTVGDQDNDLDFNESITCTAIYNPSDSDRSAGSITNRARAIVGGMVSNESTFSIGQAAATPTVRGQAELSTPAASASQTPSAIPSATQDTAPVSTETLSAIPTATPGTSSGSTETPSVIPTATLASSAGESSGPTASVDSVNVIDLPAGVETIVLPGMVPAGGSIRYSIEAAPGQQL